MSKKKISRSTAMKMTKDLKIKRLLIFLAVVSFGSYFAYNYQIPKGSHVADNYEYKDVYPATEEQALKNITSPIKISLNRTTFNWINYIYEGIIALYILMSFCRRQSLAVLSTWFYIFWSFGCLAEMAYTTALLRMHFLGRFLLTGACTIFRHIAAGFHLHSLHRYLRDTAKPSGFDVWCGRLLVQNGLFFHNAWSSFVLITDIAYILNNKFQVERVTSWYGSLSILAMILVGWFVIQNALIEAYCRFLFAEYICFFIVFVGLLIQTKRDFGTEHNYFKFCIGLVTFGGLLLLLRLVFIYRKRKVGYKATTKKKTKDIEMSNMEQ